MAPENFTHTNLFAPHPFDGNLGSHKLEEPQDGRRLGLHPFWVLYEQQKNVYCVICWSLLQQLINLN